MATNLVTSVATETLRSGVTATNARVTAVDTEVLHNGAATAFVTSVAVEVLRSVSDLVVTVPRSVATIVN